MHVLLLTSLAALAQLQGSQPRSAVPNSQATSDDHAAIHREMNRLFKEVELKQQEIDRLLFDAGTKQGASQPKAAASVGEIVAKARDGSELATHDIDRILELAGNHTHQGGT